jgi:hypothetical protein
MTLSIMAFIPQPLQISPYHQQLMGINQVHQVRPIQIFGVEQHKPIKSTFCCAQGCRHSDKHVTQSHRCERCKKYGHGIYECGNSILERYLMQAVNFITIPHHLQCTSPGCRFSTMHTTEGHFCKKCREFHSIASCKNRKQLSPRDIIITALTKFSLFCEDQIYVMIYVGQGSYYYVKRYNMQSELKLFFMHSDKWGHYGQVNNDRPKLASFLHGYKNIETGKYGL